MNGGAALNTEEKLKDLIILKYGSLRKFCVSIDMSPSTLTAILSRGIKKASIQNVIKICQSLDISTDELAEGRIIPNDHKQRQALRLLAYARELTTIIDFGREYKEAYEPYAIDGVDMSQEETELFLDGIELLTNLIRKQRLRKDMKKRLNQKNQKDFSEIKVEL